MTLGDAIFHVKLLLVFIFGKFVHDITHDCLHLPRIGSNLWPLIIFTLLCLNCFFQLHQRISRVSKAYQHQPDVVSQTEETQQLLEKLKMREAEQTEVKIL